MMRLRRPTPEQEDAVLRTVVYASIFDYPLTLAQVRESLVGMAADEAEIERWYDASPLLQAAIDRVDGFFLPHGRQELIDVRRAREVISREALRELQGALRLVTRMPFVRLVALSGSLAHLNADREADLDLFVVTRGGRVWSVTFTLLLLARLCGWRRRLCLNYVISERALDVEPRDMFSANQIVHLRPLVGAATYDRFLAANAFVREIYPNFEPRPAADERPRSTGQKIFEGLINVTVGPLYEWACRRIYGRHLARRAHLWRSRDQVRLERECLKLHTSSHRATVMARFHAALADAVASEAPRDAGRDAELRLHAAPLERHEVA